MAETCVLCKSVLKDKYRLRDWFGRPTGQSLQMLSRAIWARTSGLRYEVNAGTHYYISISWNQGNISGSRKGSHTTVNCTTARKELFPASRTSASCQLSDITYTATSLPLHQPVSLATATAHLMVATPHLVTRSPHSASSCAATYMWSCVYAIVYTMHLVHTGDCCMRSLSTHLCLCFFDQLHLLCAEGTGSCWHKL